MAAQTSSNDCIAADFEHRRHNENEPRKDIHAS
jgi:hypothetical protein